MAVKEAHDSSADIYVVTVALSISPSGLCWLSVNLLSTGLACISMR